MRHDRLNPQNGGVARPSGVNTTDNCQIGAYGTAHANAVVHATTWKTK
jgi:hypothetical protein